jgi:hypothetical protein
MLSSAQQRLTPGTQCASGREFNVSVMTSAVPSATDSITPKIYVCTLYPGRAVLTSPAMEIVQVHSKGPVRASARLPVVRLRAALSGLTVAGLSQRLG